MGDVEVKQQVKAEKKEEDLLYPVDRKDLPYGVIPELQGLNVQAAYRKMLADAGGDKQKIRAFLGKIGFTQGLPLSYSFTTMSVAEQQAYSASLALFSKELQAEGLTQKAHSAEAFSNDAALRERFASTFVVLKYVESSGPRYWQTWAKEMRGNVIAVNPETMQEKILGFKLPRGAEVLTNMHSKSDDADTQDIKGGRVDILDAEQQDTCQRLVGLQKIDGHLSSKGDGSLLAITVYTGDALRLLRATVKAFGNDYVKLWMEKSLRLSGGKVLALPSTQGTLWEGGFMAEYMVTSILVGSQAATRDQLNKLELDGKTHLDAWTQFGDSVVKKILQMPRFDDLSESHCFCFEAICQGRRGVWEPRLHVELACEYDRDRLIFLGVSICEKRFYIPHSAYGQLFLKGAVPFEEPLWWDITDAAQIHGMMEDMDAMVLGDLSKARFLEKWKPRNMTAQHNDDPTEAILDFEGWVFMKKAALPISDPEFSEVMTATGCPLMVYSKIKTESYYLTHKFKPQKIPELIRLSKTAGHIFPLTQRVADFFGGSGEGDNDGPPLVAQRLADVHKAVAALFTFEKESTLMFEADLALRMLAINTDAPTNKKPTKVTKTPKVAKNPFDGFEKRPEAVQWKILINFHKNNLDSLGPRLINIFAKSFPTLDVECDGLGAELINLVMVLEFWDVAGLPGRLQGLEPESPPVQFLVKACIGHSVM